MPAGATNHMRWYLPRTQLILCLHPYYDTDIDRSLYYFRAALNIRGAVSQSISDDT